MKLSKWILFFLCAFGSLALQANGPLVKPPEPEEIVIYNRILAKVNGKTLSVLDVMKKMDLFLQKYYPDMVHSKLARYQFYSSQWRDYLSQIIDQELMLADAEILEVKVTDAEVREEMLNRFGPNIMPILDELGMTYDETRKMIHDELVVQKMMWFRVHSKALTLVNSQDIKHAYKDYCKKNPALDEWQYQVLSIRSKQQEAGEMLAKRAFELLESRMQIAALPEQLSKPDDEMTITLSPELQADDKSISASHKEVLMTLAENSYSQPIAQVSRVDNSIVYRIFHLIKHTKNELPAFQNMADKLKEQLLQQASNKEHTAYITRLRERLSYDEKHMQEILPSDYQPFALR